MRKIANVPMQGLNAVRLMIHPVKHGVLIYGYDRMDDCPCRWDAFVGTIEDAYELGEDYGIKQADWTEINDPAPGCLHDWIEPTTREEAMVKMKEVKK